MKRDGISLELKTELKTDMICFYNALEHCI